MYNFYKMYYVTKIDFVSDDKMPHKYLRSIKFAKGDFKIQF